MRWGRLLLKIPHNWMTRLLSDYDMHVRVFNCMPYKSRGGRGLVKLSSNGNLGAILNMVKNRKDIARNRFSRVSEKEAIGEVVLDKCAACAALSKSDCFMVSSKSTSGGWIEWNVAAESNSAIRDLIGELERNRCTVQLTGISNSSYASGLTQRQDQILQFAYSNGYYEFPRKMSLGELSHIFNISPATISEILRVGQKKVFSEYFSISSHQDSLMD